MDRQAAADLHRVARIDREIEHGELELSRVDQGGPQTAVELGFNADAAAHRALQQVVHACDGLVEVERFRLETLAARKRQQLIGQLCAAFGGRAHIAEALREPAVDTRRGESFFQKADIAEHHGQEVVEVMGNPGGELADGFEPLHLPQGGLHALALLDLGKQLAVGRRQLCGALLDVKFQLLVEPPAFILSLPAAQIGLHDAHKRCGMKRPLEEGDVSERLRQPGCRRIAFEAAAMLGQQYERKVRPRGLCGHPLHHCSHIGAAGRFLGQDGNVGAPPDLLHQLREIEADVGMNSRVPPDALGNDGVAAARRENKRPLGVRSPCLFQGRSPISGPRDPT